MRLLIAIPIAGLVLPIACPPTVALAAAGAGAEVVADAGAADAGAAGSSAGAAAPGTAADEETPETIAGAIGGKIEIDPAKNEIVVTAGRVRNAVIAPQAPVIELDENDIASYGAASLDELITLLAPETGSGRGRGDGQPVFLLNGQRVSNFREIREIPPEALLRVQVLPEEVALRYGFQPNQRVVNFILKDKFASRTASAEYDVPTLGGFDEGNADISLLKIAGPRRFNLTARYKAASLLTEAERDVAQTAVTPPTITVAGDPDAALYRSLLASTRTYALNTSVSTGLGAKGPGGVRTGGSLSFNGAYTHVDTAALEGLDTVVLTDPDTGQSAQRSLPGALRQTTHQDTVESGTTLNRAIGSWQLTGTLDASYGETETLTDRRADTGALTDAVAAGTLAFDGPLPSLADAGFDTARQRDIAATSLATIAGSPFRLPAGQTLLTVKAGYVYSDTRSSDTRSTAGPASFSRGDLSAGINLALPLTSRRSGVLGAIGDLSLNFSAGLDQLSDFGRLTDWSAGATWNLTTALGLQASYIVNQAAPTLAQLGAPTVQTYNVSVYDFTRGETVLATITSGGNPDLVKEEQRDLKLGVNWQLPFLSRSNLIVEYFRNRSNNVSETFPLLTPAIEAAFPDRVTRDPATGQLVAIDRRPVTFDEIASSRIRWGLNLTGSLGGGAGGGGGGGGMGGGRQGGGGGFGGGGGGGPPGGGTPPGGGGAPPGGGGGAPPGGGGLPGGAVGNGGRWNLAIYHTYNITDTATVAPGSAVLNLLDGDAITTGGVARHEIEFEGGTFYQGFGLRMNGTWSAPVTVRSTGAPDSSDLRFGSVFKIDLRAFADLGRVPGLLAKAPFLKNTRLMFKVDNVLDSRQKVTDASGTVPIAYQADYLDPTGRVIGVDLRKMF